MLSGVTALLTFQLVGEAISRATGAPTPGPVLGFILLTAAMGVSPALRAATEPAAMGLLRHLSLLFVPAAVGIVRHLSRLSAEALPVGIALIASTLLAMLATAAAFAATARWLGRRR